MQIQECKSEEREKRTWVYLRPPKHFDMAPCECGNHDTQWSEFAKHLWCATCGIDFEPKHTGVLGTPIPIKTAHLMGIDFDRVQLATDQIERWDPETCEFVPEEKKVA